jgi:hypothetical protein
MGETKVALICVQMQVRRRPVPVNTSYRRTGLGSDLCKSSVSDTCLTRSTQQSDNRRLSAAMKVGFKRRLRCSWIEATARICPVSSSTNSTPTDTMTPTIFSAGRIPSAEPSLSQRAMGVLMATLGLLQPELRQGFRADVVGERGRICLPRERPDPVESAFQQNSQAAC